MSELNDLTKKHIIITLKPKESFLLSIMRDSVTFGFIFLLVYISKDSRFWTLVSGLLFLAYFWSLLSYKLDKTCTTFNDKKTAIEYIQTLTDILENEDES